MQEHGPPVDVQGTIFRDGVRAAAGEGRALLHDGGRQVLLRGALEGPPVEIVGDPASVVDASYNVRYGPPGDAGFLAMEEEYCEIHHPALQVCLAEVVLCVPTNRPELSSLLQHETASPILAVHQIT